MIISGLYQKLSFMKYTTFFACFLVTTAVAAQNRPTEDPLYTLAAQYCHEFTLDGYVRVREFELTGDKMSLRSLGVNNYPALQLRGERRIGKSGRISIIYDNYRLRGEAMFDRDIVYNGTIIDGRRGIDVSPTQYHRFTGIYSGKLVDKNDLELSYMTGLVVDYIIFYLDGRVVPGSPKSEVYEKFGRQAFPYPMAGIRGNLRISERGKIFFETSGSYIPRFKSFYSEGGNIHLQYSNFLGVLQYSVELERFELGLGVRFRHMKLVQESIEDTNELWTLTGGPHIEIAYRL